MNAFFVVIGVSLFLVGLLSWKIFSFVKFYFLLLGLIIVVSVVELTWWALEGSDSVLNGNLSFLQSSALMVASGFSVVVVTSN